uniref:Uncharacterized protein n=1 Tax=viral metagenome TaxID=1070528 RepID=A0A6C0DKK9_9ZZZZ
MEGRITNLKIEFNNISLIRGKIINVFESLKNKMDKLKLLYSEFIKHSNTQLFIFGLDSFHFQSKLIDLENDDMKRMFLIINNRMYCEYFKLYKIIVAYVSENINDKKILEIIKGNNFPIYKDLEPFKDYKFETTIEIHDNIILLLNSIVGIINNRENELSLHKSKQLIGLNIDNFVNSFNFEITIMKEKINLFLSYMDFFHKLHNKYLKRFSNKIQLMFNHINSDIQFDENIENNNIVNSNQQINYDDTNFEIIINNSHDNNMTKLTTNDIESGFSTPTNKSVVSDISNESKSQTSVGKIKNKMSKIFKKGFKRVNNIINGCNINNIIENNNVSENELILSNLPSLKIPATNLEISLNDFNENISELEIEPDVEIVFEDVVEEQVVEESVVETVIDEPVVEESLVEEPVDDTVIDGPLVEESVIEESVVETVIDEPLVEESLVEEPVVDTVIDESLVEESVVETVIDEPVVDIILNSNEKETQTNDEEQVLEEPVIEEPLLAVEESVVEEPVIEEPVVEEPVIEEPLLAVEEPVIEEPLLAVEEPVIEEPLLAVEEPVIEEPLLAVEEPLLAVEEPLLAVEEPFVEEPVKVEEPVIEEPLLAVEESVVEEQTIIEEPVVEEPVIEEPLLAVEESVVEEQTIIEEPVVEEPVKVEEQVVEEQVVEEQVVEEPVIEEPLLAVEESTIIEGPVLETE